MFQILILQLAQSLVMFQILIGQKYGYRPFPPKIDALEYLAIHAELKADGVDVSPLDLWFKKNTNVIPAVYVLQPISSVYINYINKVQQQYND